MKNVRIRWCVIYLLIGGTFLISFCIIKCPNLQKLLTENLSNILWCLGWSSVGISLGLYNSRGGIESESETGKQSETLSKNKHYYTYYLFVLFIGVLAAFVTLLSFDGLRGYAASALTAIIIGFTGDSLAGVILKLSKIDR